MWRTVCLQRSHVRNPHEDGSVLAVVSEEASHLEHGQQLIANGAEVTGYCGALQAREEHGSEIYADWMLAGEADGPAAAAGHSRLR